MTRTTLPLVLALAIAGCSSRPPLPPIDPVAQHTAAEPAVRALRAGDFAAAAAASDQALADDHRNATAAAVRALARYQAAGEAFRDNVSALFELSDHAGPFDFKAARTAWMGFATELAAVDADLAIAAGDPDFALDLCLACWIHDWNRTRGVDDNDRLLFQIEVDASGAELPEHDPRRTPTFRFDAGDVTWARAMISFQRALSEIALAYKWDIINTLRSDERAESLIVELDDAGRMRRARELIRAGLDFSDQSRAQYLAETDDEREWVPSPRQHDHPVPLEIDAALYDTWASIVRDVRALIDGEQGIALKEVIGDLPGLDGYIDVGRLFSHPRSLRLDRRMLEDAPIATVVRHVLGPALRDRMPASPLMGRIRALTGSSEGDELGRKLRYLLWIN